MIIRKILVFILFFCILFVVKEGIMLYRSIMKGEMDMTTFRLVGLGLSLSYILTIIFTGFGI